ncbi:uncharacterized protein LOC119283394 [Triticum dicoccoides]|nr:uncharacterized protein LOC119283394 [Triticum dicoccoides]
MGSFLSSAAGAGAGAAGEADHGARPLRSPTIKECTRRMTNQELARLDGYDPVSFQELVARANAGHPTLALDKVDSAAVCKLVRCALKHYNSKNPGADFEYPAELTTEMKATGISFRERFWYHVGFLARRSLPFFFHFSLHFFPWSLTATHFLLLPCSPCYESMK